MKKLLVATAIAALSVTAQAAPTVYGKINLSLDQIGNAKYKGVDETALNSNASRIGVKGQENLIIDFLDVVYGIEWAVSTDGSTGAGISRPAGDQSTTDTDWGLRNRFIGLKFKDVGTIKAGRYDTYFKSAAGDNQDIFNDHTLDFTSMIYGEERLGNVIGFETDKKLLEGFNFNIMTQLGENATRYSAATDNGTTGLDKDKKSFTGVSASIGYDMPDFGLNVALAANYAMPGKYAAISASNIYSDAIRVTGSWDATQAGMPGLVLGALYQTAQPTDDLTAYGITAAKPAGTNYTGLQEDAFSVTAAYAIQDTPWKVKAEYVQANTSADKGLAKDRKIDQYGVGVDYSFNKKAKMYGVLAQQTQDWHPSNMDTQTIGGIGLIYNF